MKYTKSEINRAGLILANRTANSLAEVEWAENILTYWRFIHAAPINTFQANLRTILKRNGMNGFVAQRLKRSASVISKLNRNPDMQMARMQDIAGLRVILEELSDVLSLQAKLKGSRFGHEFINEKDYIDNPKDSGYRSIHLIYKYNNINTPESNGLRVEIQIRTRIQHTWATSVEIMGTYLDSSLKSSEGPKEILDFFGLASSAFALFENCKPISKLQDFDDTEILKRCIDEFDRLKIGDKLSAFSTATNVLAKQKSKHRYFLVVLDLEKKQVSVRGYTFKEVGQANIDYTDVEREISEGKNFQAVLVSLDRIESLSKAYPNYFLDSKEFLERIKSIRNRLLR